MTLAEIKKYFGVTTNADVARKLGVSKVAVGNWESEIPTERQAIIEIQTKGELKADGIPQLETA
jgi:DNA-binding XRE family transcriptional regulator|nr:MULTISPECIES: Cro/CI family transcriptional regulator [unclassified Moraxella]